MEKNNNSGLFERSVPEKEGVPSECIALFLTKLYEQSINIHSVLFFRNFKLIFDGYYEPFGENTLHRMFSVTKSFVSAAVGILAGKGKIDLDSPVIKYFPEYDRDCKDKLVRAATVRQLLKMQSPHEKTAFKQISDDDYVKSFFRLEASKVPGTAFSYDTSASHTLCALAEKISGKSLLDFLRDEFLRDLGFSDEAYCIKDPLGRSMGGSGLMAKPLDVAVFAHVFLNGGKLWGKYDGKRVIPEDYAEAAVSKQSDTFVKGGFSEEKQGYGYQFWRISHNGYMCYGIGGQLAVILPDFNFVMVTTGDTLESKNDIEKIFQMFWKFIYPRFSNEPLPENDRWFSILEKAKKSLFIEPVPFKNDFFGKNITGRVFNISENEFGIKNLTIDIIGLEEILDAEEIDRFKNKYGCESEFGKIYFDSDKGEFELIFGFDRNVYQDFPYYEYKCLASGTFLSDNVLIVKCHIIDEEIGTVWFQADVNASGEGVLLTKKNVGTGFEEFNRCYIITCDVF